MTTDYVGSVDGHKIVTTWTSKYSFYTYKRKTINPCMGIICIQVPVINLLILHWLVKMYQYIAIIFAFHILFFRLIEFYLFFLSFDVFFLNQCTIYYTINISHDCIFHVQLLKEKHFCNDLAKIWISAPLKVCLYNCMFQYDIHHRFFHIYIVKAAFCQM